MKLSKFTSFNFHPSQKLNVCECVRKAKTIIMQPSPTPYPAKKNLPKRK